MKLSVNEVIETPIQYYIDAFFKYHSVRVLVLTNLFPLAGALLFVWRINELFITYWLETIIIQLVTALKIYYASGDIWRSRTTDIESIDRSFRIGSIIQYLAVSLLFTIAYGSIIVQTFGVTTEFLSQIEIIPLLILFLSLSFSHGYSFKKDYIDKKEYLHTSENDLRSGFFHRFYIMHMALWAGGIIGIYISNSLPYVVFLIFLKIIFDIAQHLHKDIHKLQQ